MPILPIQFSVAPFAPGWAGDNNAYAQQLITNLSAQVQGNFLTGQIGGNQPTTNVGPWLNNGQWWFWNSTTNSYQPQTFVSSTNGNVLINGSMQVAQWAPSNLTLAAVTSPVICVDRWSLRGISSGSGGIVGAQARISQNTASNIPSGSFNPFCLFSARVTNNIGAGTVNPGEYLAVIHTVERSCMQPLFNNNISLGLWLRSSITGTYCVSICNMDTSQSYVTECAITSANTWQLFQFPAIPAFNSGSGNWGTNPNDFGIQVRVCLVGGANFRGTINTWNANNALCTTNQINFLAVTASTLDIGLVKLEAGTSCTPITIPVFSDEMARCQRYSWTSAEYGIMPYFVGKSNLSAQNAFLTTEIPLLGNAFGTLINAGIPFSYPFPVPMRATPTFNQSLVCCELNSPFQTNVLTDLVDNSRATLSNATFNMVTIGELANSSGAPAQVKAGHVYGFNLMVTAEV